MMSSSVLSPDVEHLTFHRSQSRVFYQSDCSTPTSWQFHGLGAAGGCHEEGNSLKQSPMPLALSLVRRMSDAETPTSEIRADGSRNSTGSSTASSSGSHKSQDSGFSDSGAGERRGLGNRQPKRLDLHTSQRPGPSHLVTRTQSPLLVSMNGTPAILHRSVTTTTDCAHSLQEECSNCIYQEVIVARSIRGKISPLPEETAEKSGNKGSELGIPACCSTPIKSFQVLPHSQSRLSVMQKIDNFESLNKNARVRDSNNNSSSHADSSILPPPMSQTQSKLQTSNSQIIAPNTNLNFNNSDSIVVRDDSMSTTTTMVNEFASYASRSKVFVKNSPKWRSLPRGYKRVPAPNVSSDKIIVKSQFDNPAVRLWLHELRFQTEPECLYSFQVKEFPNSSIAHLEKKLAFKHPRRYRSTGAISTPILSIRSVERVASLISGEFSKICKHLELSFLPQVPCLVLNLVDHIEDFLRHLEESFGNLHKVETRLATSCYQLRVAVTAVIDGENGHYFRSSLESPGQGESVQVPESNPNVLMIANLVEGIVGIGNLFSSVVDQRLTRDLSSLLDVIERPGLGAFVALQSLATILYDGGMHFCRLAANIRTVRGLLSSLLDAREEEEQILALRCLATVLCIGEAVKDFDKAGGFEIVADILYDSGCSLELKYEAVAALTQATDPWIDLETTLCSLGTHLEKIVVSLTNLIPQCKTDEDGFLLTLAAISNLTFLELSSIEFLRFYKTVYLIIDAVKRKSDFSVFVMDHVATVLANMAGMENCRHDIVQSDGIVILLHFLQIRPPSNAPANEITAYERLQQKSTIAISRLANEPGVAQVVMETHGIERLVQLSTQEKERNYSDGVLIACLATLRKLVTICGDEMIRKLNAEELIQPRLLDSFLLFSSRQESYV